MWFCRNDLEEKKENEKAMRKFQKEERRARRKARQVNDEHDIVDRDEIV